VDIVALLDENEQLVDPIPPGSPPASLRPGCGNPRPSEELLNNGPSKGEGGKYRLGLPEVLCVALSVGKPAQAGRHFISRWDQIHFKLYATIDRGGYHLNDLQALQPKTRRSRRRRDGQ
jgi:hypothetical protein